MNVLPSKSNLFLDFDSLTISSHSPSSSFDDRPTVIDTFAPKPLRDLSPTPSPTPMTGVSPSSSASSDFESYLSSPSRFSYEAFVTTRSRVVRLYNLPRLAESFLSALFLPQSNLRGQHPEPISLWTTSEEYPGCRPDSIWAVFKTHEEAVSALSLSGPTMSVTTALESDLEPFHKLRRFVLNPPVSARRLM
ncbi:hypothetical protein C0989_007637 [Termitomyces sp. Mn162]|nr:hypothetical protein C0989_007637 [Termitomyces sp. Mn162]